MSLAVDLRSVVELLVTRVCRILALVLLVLHGQRDYCQEAEDEPQSDETTNTTTEWDVSTHNTVNLLGLCNHSSTIFFFVRQGPLRFHQSVEAVTHR